VKERVSAGIDPLYVGELVREVIENDWPYIFTDATCERDKCFPGDIGIECRTT